MIRFIFAGLLLTSPIAANACDLDGMFGMHRYNPFAGREYQPQSSPAGVDPTPAQVADIGDERSSKRRAERERAITDPAPPSQPEEPRKWEVDGGSPVSAEDMATFT